MSTRRLLRVDPTDCRSADLEAAADWLRAGGIVAYPTDTLYGLAVDPMSGRAVDALCALKGRPPGMALPLVASSIEQVVAFAGPLGPLGARLAARFWPGPLALVLDAPPAVVPVVHGGRGTIAIRVPANAVARALAEVWGAPITATSANRSGAPPVASAALLGPFVDDARVFVVDGGAAPGGEASTIVDARGTAPVLVREGAVPWRRVLAASRRGLLESPEE
jgi:L-threonylcarbamoyladenylate synthase